MTLIAVDYYKEDLPHEAAFPTEYRMRVRKWLYAESSELPKKLIDTLKACDAVSFPYLSVLLKIALTLPVTSCESKRSFSQLKLIKSTLRSTIGADRL